jgi:hypothetical protein
VSGHTPEFTGAASDKQAIQASIAVAAPLAASAKFLSSLSGRILFDTKTQR